jgi:hypothetical protein
VTVVLVMVAVRVANVVVPVPDVMVWLAAVVVANVELSVMPPFSGDMYRPWPMKGTPISIYVHG